MSTLPSFLQCRLTEAYSYLAFHQPMHCLSNAPHLGGSQHARGVFNMKVGLQLPAEQDPSEQPWQTLARALQQHDIPGPCVGLMTAASMKSFRLVVAAVGDYSVVCAVTCGLANARRVGDAADFNELIAPQRLPPGTINIMLVSDAPLVDGARVEALALVVEAKTAACYDHVISSATSGRIATGTGTDVALVASPILTADTQQLLYCGKHTVLGECIGKCVYEAVSHSIQACLNAG